MKKSLIAAALAAIVFALLTPNPAFAGNPNSKECADAKKALRMKRGSQAAVDAACNTPAPVVVTPTTTPPKKTRAATPAPPPPPAPVVVAPPPPPAPDPKLIERIEKLEKQVACMQGNCEEGEEEPLTSANLWEKGIKPIVMKVVWTFVGIILLGAVIFLGLFFGTKPWKALNQTKAEVVKLRGIVSVCVNLLEEMGADVESALRGEDEEDEDDEPDEDDE